MLAILIPCYNEELTIEKVVTDFKKAKPKAKIYVYDNNSTDRTAELARKAGAIVINESLQGKGNAVRSMFRDIDADEYVMVDGDDTYPADEVDALLSKLEAENADMVIGDRLSSTYYTENKRPFHNFGNTLVKKLLETIYGVEITDVMTGYRAFSKRFVKCMPVMSAGFELETEMTAFALENHFRIASVPVGYRDRPEGSVSKLNTIKDGIKVLLTIFNILKNNKPLYLYGLMSFLFLVFGLITKAVPILALSIILVIAGLVVDTVKTKTKELETIEFNRVIAGLNEQK